jgi:hypothetical protein
MPRCPAFADARASLPRKHPVPGFEKNSRIRLTDLFSAELIRATKNPSRLCPSKAQPREAKNPILILFFDETQKIPTFLFGHPRSERTRSLRPNNILGWGGQSNLGYNRAVEHHLRLRFA